MDVEAVSKSERTALLEVRADLFLVDIRLLLIGDEDHRDIRLLHRIGNRRDLQTMSLSLRLGLRAGVETDDDIETALLEVSACA